ncbi:MAG: hypothetical protein Q7J58_01655 [Hydrogenophaga sp.]|jgi:hypothetical protein|uniref:hypothetical protein n=1 Tax=Hydrogenophaga sp. TaxID=1904254 RepID=UPI00271C52E4|nr:hypothetical protein [Hydrogenophaga sp.]MDO9568075.1 hypothetical protein [Hydrogenophaga sp.]MDP3374370.1 hypothetical protein [Hydrogenophaga sp.]
MNFSTTHTQDDFEKDVLNIFSSLLKTWFVLDAIRKTVPEQQANSVTVAAEEVMETMGRLVKRFGIKVSIDSGDRGEVGK